MSPHSSRQLLLVADSSSPLDPEPVNGAVRWVALVRWAETISPQEGGVTGSTSPDSSNAGTADASFKYVVVPSGDERTVTLALDIVTVPSAGYDNFIKTKARDIVHQLYVSADPRLADARKKLMKHSEDETFALIEPALPLIEPLGRLVQNAVISYQGKNDLSSGLLNIENIEISSRPYGITVKGTVEAAPDKFFVPHVKLECRNCIAMIDDGFFYSQRVSRAVANFDPEAAEQIAIDPFRVGGLKAFLTELAGSTGPDLVYTVTGDGTPNVSINGKKLDEVRSIYGKYLPLSEGMTAPAPEQQAEPEFLPESLQQPEMPEGMPVPPSSTQPTAPGLPSLD